jgi:S-phase kinase-associated protein 1
MTSTSEKKIILKSSDNVTFEVEHAIALECKTIKLTIEDNCAEKTEIIPIPNVTGTILSKVIEYLKKHVEAGNFKGKHSNNVELNNWDADFVKVDEATLVDLISAAHFLNIESLLDLTSQAVADMMKSTTPEEIQNTFNIVNDSSTKNEKQVNFENEWSFE